ncbi:tubulin epsilon chain-like [Clytia hemisphaerica]|uniref:Tubulin epsilon chain n=1 Tax=Clytia hemisphaerica TaxID=252671 RepID=A0A7M5UBB9_9CNID
MTQSIVVQVGQCGNQIGYRFWDAALREYETYGESQGDPSSSLSFFSKTPLGKKAKKQTLKARAVLIDMEEGVINEILSSRLRGLFDNNQLITDVSGAGNNWAVGHLEYGQQYKESFLEVIRKTVEDCDCLQCFFCIHSMGGGTGSGVGTFVLKLLEDEYPEIFRFSTVVYPSETDDVITSPYNSVLAMHNLTESADCVLSIENQALLRIVQKMSMKSKNEKLSGEKKGDSKAFDEMNDIVANLLVNLTCSARFEGSLNVDLNEISMNLVPFPKLHYITSSMAPIYSLSKKTTFQMRNTNQMFTDTFTKDFQLMNVDPARGLYLACSLLVRGNVEISDIRQNIERLKPNLNFIHWNQEGWKVGLCSIPPLNSSSELLTLANSTCFHHPCIDIRNRFMKLYKRKAHLHHYTRVEGFDAGLIEESLHSLDSLIDQYEDLERSTQNPIPSLERLKVA